MEEIHSEMEPQDDNDNDSEEDDIPYSNNAPMLISYEDPSDPDQLFAASAGSTFKEDGDKENVNSEDKGHRRTSSTGDIDRLLGDSTSIANFEDIALTHERAVNSKLLAIETPNLKGELIEAANGAYSLRI